MRFVDMGKAIPRECHTPGPSELHRQVSQLRKHAIERSAKVAEFRLRLRVFEMTSPANHNPIETVFTKIQYDATTIGGRVPAGQDAGRKSFIKRESRDLETVCRNERLAELRDDVVRIAVGGNDDTARVNVANSNLRDPSTAATLQ